MTLLKGPDKVRKRPAVIFGSDGLDGCQHAAFEIISNSIDEAREGFGNKIIVTLYADNSIEVQDFGEGISPQVLPHIWERYFKDNKNSNRNIKSSGLGLSIVKTFVEAHNGECGVESKPGEGSKFWFSINL
jgi:signal transduction histidine kinase